MNTNMNELSLSKMGQVNGGIADSSNNMLVGDLPAELEGALGGLPVGAVSAEKLAELTRA